MIRFEHTLFALPFAFLGMLLVAEGWPSWRTVFWIVVAMVGARSAGDGVQPAGRPGDRRRQPAHRVARPAGGGLLTPLFSIPARFGTVPALWLSALFHAACPVPFERFWVFATGLTDVATTLEVEDVFSGARRAYFTAPGVSFPPLQDTDAFPTCE